MNEYIKDRLKKIGDGLSCKACPLKSCIGRCLIFKAIDTIEKMESDLQIERAESMRARRFIEKEEEKA